MHKTSATAAIFLLATALGSEEAMQQALSTWDQQVADYKAALQDAPSDEAKAALTAPDGRDIAPALWQSMSARTGTRKSPKGNRSLPTYEFENSWALPGIIWILEHPQAFTAAFTDEEQAQLTYYGNAIVDSLVRVHFSNPAVGGICPSISASSSVREYELLQKIYQRNQNKEARACAALGMSLMLNNPMVCSIEGSDSMARAKRLYYLKQSILLSGEDTKFGSQPLVEVAMEQAYFLRHLIPGSIAPQLHLKDTQGTAHTLPASDTITLLVFWSPADPIGTALLKDTARLEALYPGLKICPIMPHAPQDAQQKALDELGLEESYTDDAQGTAARTYRISLIPSTILIGKDSRIIYGGAPDMKLQAALERVAAQEHAANKAPRASISIEHDEPAPIQPGASSRQNEADRNNKVPELRDMPAF